jgi:hypothetical protein
MHVCVCMFSTIVWKKGAVITAHALQKDVFVHVHMLIHTANLLWKLYMRYPCQYACWSETCCLESCKLCVWSAKYRLYICSNFEHTLSMHSRTHTCIISIVPTYIHTHFVWCFLQELCKCHTYMHICMHAYIHTHITKLFICHYVCMLTVCVCAFNQHVHCVYIKCSAISICMYA